MVWRLRQLMVYKMETIFWGSEGERVLIALPVMIHVFF